MLNFLERLVNSFIEPRRHIYDTYLFERWYRQRTPFGFFVSYQLSGCVDVVDKKAFTDAYPLRGGIQSAISAFVDDYHDSLFCDLIEENRLFFHYDFTHYGDININFWQYTEAEDGILAVEWKNFYSGLNLAVERAKDRFHRDGCVMDLVNLHFTLNDAVTIQENVNMLHPEVIATIRQNGSYLALVEQICVAALAERAKLFRDSKKYGHESLTTIHTQIVGNALKLSWKNAKAGESWKLLGFRKTGGFALNEVSETENGLLIMDSAQAEGETVEAKLPRNEPVYYTFFLKKDQRYWPVARFSETIPDEDTVQALVKQLEETRLKAQIAEAERKAAEIKQGKPSFAEERRKGIESQLQLAKDALGLLRAVDAIEADAFKELEQAPDRFTTERAEAWRDEVADLCSKLRENVRRLV